ncbi:MAG: excisionase family DNA-binding protein [candidate division Zixibacteria bacterium]|nr:excisionase family DNA-binding protein [candidate division Zixibacteria bacterium]
MNEKDDQIQKFQTKEFVSTGQAAELCSVTADTVLKWIKSGRISANRTPGGHYRIRRETLISIIDDGNLPDQIENTIRPFQFCWEFYKKNGGSMEKCQECTVYRSRAMRCYEMIQLPAESGHARMFCKGSCDDCEYFRVVQGQRLNILVITEQENLKTELETQAKDVDFNLRLTDDGYHCSMVIENFRPDFVVIDSSIGIDRCKFFTKHLSEDPRVPYVRIILAGELSQVPSDCDKMIFAVINRPFTTGELESLIGLARQGSLLSA